MTLPMPSADFVVFVIVLGLDEEFRVKDVSGLIDVNIVIPISIQGDETQESWGGHHDISHVRP